YDDFRDVDLKGKIAVFLSGAPSLPALSSTARSLPGDLRVKWKAAAARGAVGFVNLLTPERLRVASFEASARSARRRSVVAADPQPLGPGVTLRPGIAEALLSAAGHPVAKPVERAAAGHPVIGDLRASAHLRI